MDDVARAAAAIRAADALVVAAGAGMGVDSGLPDFRGPEGFWRAYPPYRALGLRFEDLAAPHWFDRDPTLAWGFYGHRLNLYRATTPHEGFAVLRGWAERMRHGAFTFTSNVDGQFQRAGFPDERIVECHGAIRTLQCLRDCGVGLLPDDGVVVDVDPTTFRAREPLPRCRCGALLRPNILMFSDFAWDASRTDAQAARFEAWFDGVRGSRVVVVECGAGTALPTVRRFAERIAARTGGALVRINVREPQGAMIGIAQGARDALAAIDAAI
jgi:NAD-dependent SIR2 family protein deacetylase